MTVHRVHATIFRLPRSNKDWDGNDITYMKNHDVHVESVARLMGQYRVDSQQEVFDVFIGQLNHSA